MLHDQSRSCYAAFDTTAAHGCTKTSGCLKPAGGRLVTEGDGCSLNCWHVFDQ